MFAYLTSQHATEGTTLLILLMTAALAMTITQRYAKVRSRALLFWSVGIWLFALGVAFEIAFALGFYSQLLIDSYLFIVALIVESLALGSIQLVRKRWLQNSYYIYCALTTLLLAYSLFTVDQGNLMVFEGMPTHVVSGAPTLQVIIASSLITFPAALVLFLVAFKSYMKKKDPKMVSIMLGVVEVSVAGTLYIAQYPAFLYLSELVGIILLWYGFI